MGVIVAMVLAALVGITGYILNIIKLVGSDTFHVEEAIRVLGIFAAPIGAIMGLFVS